MNTGHPILAAAGTIIAFPWNPRRDACSLDRGRRGLAERAAELEGLLEGLRDAVTGRTPHPGRVAGRPRLERGNDVRGREPGPARLRARVPAGAPRRAATDSGAIPPRIDAPGPGVCGKACHEA